ncbi:Helix-turn-helix domain protein [Xanthomonas sp. SI]|nr:Helix-turn-helix domain protein [Xanthomonas sp. SI]
MLIMRRNEAEFATTAAVNTAKHLAMLVKQARMARGWSQAGLAERARISAPTMNRIEKGSLGASLGAWLAVLERVGLLHKLNQLDDPASKAIMDSTKAKRPIRMSSQDLDF